MKPPAGRVGKGGGGEKAENGENEKRRGHGWIRRGGEGGGRKQGIRAGKNRITLS